MKNSLTTAMSCAFGTSAAARGLSLGLTASGGGVKGLSAAALTAEFQNAKGCDVILRFESYLPGLEPESDTPSGVLLKATITFGAVGQPELDCTPKCADDFALMRRSASRCSPTPCGRKLRTKIARK